LGKEQQINILTNTTYFTTRNKLIQNKNYVTCLITDIAL
jgi:hypothetical protein